MVQVGNSLTKRKVLNVEDNEINREMLTAYLEEDGFEVLEAENGEIGWELFEKHYNELSLVVLDIVMPVCDGHEFLRRREADERYHGVPVIVASASGSLDDEIKCLELGANDFIKKPYEYEIMMNRIQNTVRLRENASIVNQLTFDELTGLYTKVFFYRNVEDQLKLNPNGDYDMVCSDIENFKSLNERYGEKHCDDLLKSLSEIMSTHIPGVVAGCRLSGDTLAFLIEHQNAGWGRPFIRAHDRAGLGLLNTKFGIVEHIDASVPVALTCDRALLALEGIKGRMGSEFARFDDEMRQKQLTEQLLVESMETALKERQFSVWFQPKHDLATDKTGGAEALARWIHPELGFVSPAVFIPLFERNGFITKLDMYIWEEVCKQIKRLGELGLPQVPISVNASRLDFDLPDLAWQIASLADKYGIDRSLLHVELTESAYSENPQRVIEALEDLRAYGFSTELDDFGAGYSSLASLNTLPLDVLKLDMSLIRQATQLNDFRIVQSTIQLAKIMGLRTVVEGVESVDEIDRLTELGADLIQGYYYSKPLKPHEFEEYMAQ